MRKMIAKGSIATRLAIAMDCGFNSKSSFNRTFKQLIGKTPSQYAKEII